MKVASLILAHRNPRQLKRLVLTLQQENFDVLVQIDKKSSIDPSEIPCQSLKTHKIYWGDFSTILASVELFRKALTIKSDYYFLISGQDYLLKPKKIIDGILSNGSNDFMTYYSMPFSLWGLEGGFDRLERYHFPKSSPSIQNKILKYQYLFRIKRRLPQQIEFYGGSQWFTVSHETLKYLVKHAPDFYPWYRNTLLADESIFQTILLNSPLKDRVINNNLRHLAFNNETKMAITFNESHLEELCTSPAVFGRKFDCENDQNLLDEIDKNRNAVKGFL